MKTLVEYYNTETDNVSNNELIEQLAELEHDQWMTWAKSLMEKEDLSPDRVKRWNDECMMPYGDLSEEMKEYDRVWARKMVTVYDKYHGDK